MTKQVQTSLTHEEIAALDKLAEEQARSRSFIIAQFVRQGLKWAPLYYRDEHVGRIDSSNGMVVASAKASGFRIGE